MVQEAFITQTENSFRSLPHYPIISAWTAFLMLCEYLVIYVLLNRALFWNGPLFQASQGYWGCHCSFEIHVCTLTIFHALFLFCSEASRRTIHKAVSMNMKQSLFQQMLCLSLVKELAGEIFYLLYTVMCSVWSFCLPTADKLTSVLGLW